MKRSEIMIPHLKSQISWKLIQAYYMAHHFTLESILGCAVILINLYFKHFYYQENGLFWFNLPSFIQ